MPNQRYSPNKIIISLALLGVLAVGLWLRLRFIHTVRLYPDEFVTLLAIQMIGQKGLPFMPSGLFYEHGLLFSYAGWVAGLLGSAQVAGPAQVAGRYASLLFGLLTLVLTFWVGRRWFSPAVGFLAFTALAVAPAAIHWSGRVRMYALFQLLVLLTLWLAYEGVVRNRARWRWAALLAYLGALLTQFAAVALAPPLLLGLGMVAWSQLPPDNRLRKRVLPALFDRSRWKTWLEMVALAVILVIAFWVKRLGQPKGIEALAPENTLTGLAQVWAIYSDFSFNLVDGWWAISPFFLALPALIFTPFALFVIIGEWLEIRQTKNNALATLYLFLILLVTTLEMILTVSPDRRDDKYLFMLLPLLFLLGARGMVVAGRLLWRSSSLLSPLLSVFIAAFILMASRAGVQSLLTNLGDDYEAAFVFVRDHRQPGDTILTGTPAAAALYLGHNDFYSVQRPGGYDYRILTVNNRQVDRWLGSPAITEPAMLHTTLANNNVWLVLERWGVQREYYDLPFQQQLLAQTDYVGETQGIFILRSKPDPRPVRLNPAQPLDAVLGDKVRLTGYTVEPEHPGPGQAIRLTLYWQALAPMQHDYTVFIHLREPGSGNVAQADHRPLGNVYPTSLWPVGETIRETSDGLGGSILFLPPDLPPGDYQLWAGMYLLETGERLPVQNDTSGENAVRLGTLTID